MPKFWNRFFVVLLFIIMTFCLISCGPSRTVRITDQWEPLYTPKFDYQIADNTKEFSGFTIGIIHPEFIEQGFIDGKKNVWRIANGSDREKQYLIKFKREISNAFEKILLSKGNKVLGPYTSYQEMTFPERERCNFLIKPTFIVDLETNSIGNFQILEDVGGPNLEAYAFGNIRQIITGNTQMDYVILDPLTQEKLERHKLTTESVSVEYTAYFQGMYDSKTNKPIDFTTITEHAKQYPNNYASKYYDSDNASAQILESLFVKFVPQVEKLISVDEFKYLTKYQKMLREKKVY